MQLMDILRQYPEEGLDQLARDKLDEVANVRLPRSVIEQEVATALSSFSYVAEVMASSFPPTYAFIKLLMEQPDHTVDASGFREQVLARTDSITEWVDSGAGLPSHKDYKLYLALLFAAWEEGSAINKSEGRMLEALREELGLSMREHLLLEHHPQVRPIWDASKSYESARNYLLNHGLVLAVDDRYVLPDEVRIQVRSHWGMELHDADYRQLLDQLTGTNLRDILEANGLQVSGSKEERIERIVLGLVPPSAALAKLSLDDLKSIGRKQGQRVGMLKLDLITELVSHFDMTASQNQAESEDVTGSSSEKPKRQMHDNDLSDLLVNFSGNQLYEMLAGFGLARFGTKAERIQRLVECGHSEYKLFDQLRRNDLAKLCRKMGLPVSGLKEELIERLCNKPLHSDSDDLMGGSPGLQVAASEDLNTSLKAMDNGPMGAERANPEVPGMEYIRHNFPGLADDEQVMLALHREARSLNERDVQRLANRHGLGWTLPKAHMAEMLRKLSELNEPPLRVRSTGAANIYEWTGTADSTPERIDQWAARDVIDALRQGVVPERHLEMMFVGQQKARTHLVEQMDYVSTGRSGFKFIRGAYGAGKSFMMSWLRDAALSRGFSVSTVRVSAELSLSNLANFYGGLMDGLRVPEKRGASSLSDILEAWLLTIQRRVEQIEGLSSARPDDRDLLTKLVRDRIGQELSQLASYDPGLAPALGAFYEARIEANEEQAMAALAWLRGDRSLSNAALRQIGVKGALEPEQVLARLRALLEIINTTHLKGLVILIDELELVRRRPHKQTRDQAYETLRALIDEAGENRLPGCLLVSTGTDTFFDDRRYGLASYEALYHRVSAPEMADGLHSVRQPVLILEGLNKERLSELAERTRSIHATAYGWAADQRLQDSDLKSLVDKWTAFGGDCIDRLPRPFLRQLVHVLDICEENPQIEARECFAEPEEDLEANEALMRLVAD